MKSLTAPPSLCHTLSCSALQAGETERMKPMLFLHVSLLVCSCLLCIHGVHCLDLGRCSQYQHLWWISKTKTKTKTSIFSQEHEQLRPQLVERVSRGLHGTASSPLLAGKREASCLEAPITILTVVPPSPGSSWKGSHTLGVPTASCWLPKASRHLPIW